MRLRWLTLIHEHGHKSRRLQYWDEQSGRWWDVYEEEMHEEDYDPEEEYP